MVVGAARAQIASTTYVDRIADTKQDKLGYIAEDSANRTGTIAAAASASDVKYPNEKAVATALAGKQANLDADQLAAVNSGITSAKVAQIDTNKNSIATLNGADTVAGSVAQQIKAATDDINTDMAGKADKATTLAGYGITDAYTKTEADGKYQTQDNLSTSANIATDAAGANKDVKYASAGAAQTLADAAKTAAITAAASDATTKANKALADAKTYVDENAYVLGVATADNLGGVKSGGDISVNATTGAVTVNDATHADSADSATNATNATKATQDASGNVITETYATKTELNGVKTTANAALPKATYDSQVGTVSAANMGTTATTVVAGIKEAVTEAGAAQSTANAAKTTADAALPKTTYDSQVGTVSAANMGTTATTVVTGIKEAVTEAAAAQSTADTAKTNAATAQSTADSALSKANAAIPQPSGDCTDCVLHFNGTAFSWEEIGR